MENFKSVSDAMQFSPEKMKKTGLFETERMFCDLYCFEKAEIGRAHV